MTPKNLHGLMAEFEEHDQVLHAARQAFAAGYRRMDAFTPFPVPGLAQALGQHSNAIPLLTLLSGIGGGLLGYFLQYFAMAVDYPLNVGGRPFNSWPLYIPVTFELTILSAALCAIISMIALNKLPQLHHPLFAAEGFHHATQDRFFLCIEARDPKFDRRSTKVFLESLNPYQVTEVQ